MSGNGFDYDVIVIGSGFGGSVAALRATEKGYRVGVMESGKRWNDEDLPHTSWDMRKFLWQPFVAQARACDGGLSIRRFRVKFTGLHVAAGYDCPAPNHNPETTVRTFMPCGGNCHVATHDAGSGVGTGSSLRLAHFHRRWLHSACRNSQSARAVLSSIFIKLSQ